MSNFHQSLCCSLNCHRTEFNVTWADVLFVIAVETKSYVCVRHVVLLSTESALSEAAYGISES